MIKKILSNTFISGLILALSVVLTDWLQAYINHTIGLDYNALLIAGSIAAAGYIGKFLTGAANTTLALIGSAILAIVPLIETGHVDYKIVIATIALKFLGLFSAEAAKNIHNE